MIIIDEVSINLKTSVNYNTYLFTICVSALNFGIDYSSLFKSRTFPTHNILHGI